MKVETLHTVYLRIGDKQVTVPPGTQEDASVFGLSAAMIDDLEARGALRRIDSDAQASDPAKPAPRAKAKAKAAPGRELDA